MALDPSDSNVSLKEQIKGHVSALRLLLKEHNRRGNVSPIRLRFDDAKDQPRVQTVVTWTVGDADIKKPFKEAMKTPLTRRIIEFTGPEFKMPTNIKLYDETTNPEDHLSCFSSATNSGEWPMPVWCSMFQQTFDGSTRGWFKNLPNRSIDGWAKLRLQFTIRFSTRRACFKDLTEIIKIVKRANETLVAFKERWIVETGFITGVSEVMKISSFIDAHKCPELARRFSDKVLKMVDEMMTRLDDFMKEQREEHVQQQRWASTISHFGPIPSAQRSKPAMPHIQPQIAHQAAQGNICYGILAKPTATQADAVPAKKENQDRYCDYHGEKGHYTNECFQLKRHLEMALESGKLNHLIKDVRGILGRILGPKSVRRPGGLAGGNVRTLIRKLEFRDEVAVEKHTDGSSTFHWGSGEALGQDRVGEAGKEENDRKGSRSKNSPRRGRSKKSRFNRTNISQPGIPGSAGYDRGKPVRRMTNLEAYVDDMVIKNNDEKMLIADFFETFDNLQRINMKLNPKKCSFGVEEGKFLGYMVTSEGIQANPKKTKAIANMQTPQTLKEMQSLSEKLAVLKSTEKAFQEMKQCIVRLPLLTTPVKEEMLYVYLAVATEAVSTVLLTERKGKQCPIHYVSRTLNEAERNYSPMEKLALSLLYISRRLGRYFEAHPINDKYWPTSYQRLQWEPILRSSSDSQPMYQTKMTLKNGLYLPTVPRITRVREYEALLPGLRMAKMMKVQDIDAKVNSKLVASQINESYTASSTSMIKYLATTKECIAGFRSFFIQNIPKNLNQKADNLSKLATHVFDHLTKKVLVEVLSVRSTDQKEVSVIVEEEEDNWMTPIV
uniref:Reverse transcriptase domain-containing protein n=1 Tax=Tanacetum cinerariifolium TaxID=118510 RepID=A0A6L2M2G2_TANCI|nr:reverse transcriptase domain-containing protein [Tanacetum cinerariifolium]